jgi:hypothetical protein
MPTFIEETFATNLPALSATILEYAPTTLQKEAVQAPVSFQTQAVAEPIEDTSAKEEADAKAKKAEWLRMYFLGYI